MSTNQRPSSSTRHASFLLFFFFSPLAVWSQSSNSNSTPPNSSSAPSNSSLSVRGCGPGLDPRFWFLCDRRSAWGIVLETLAAAGFLLSLLLLLGLLLWSACVLLAKRRQQRSGFGAAVAAASLFLISTAGIFGLTFAFIVRLGPQTCPPRIFLFGVLFALAFSCLLARAAARLGMGAARGWGEPGLVLGLSTVQVIIATEWLVLVLVRDQQPCSYSQEEFVMLLVYVLLLLAVALVLAAVALRSSCCSSYSYPSSSSQPRHLLLFLTLLLCASVWLVWIVMLTRGNADVGRRPRWDDPTVGVALVTSGWVLLLGYGLPQVALFCRGEARSKDVPLSFAGWTSPSAEAPGLASPKEGRGNGSDNLQGGGAEQPLRSPYESGFSMTDIDPQKDYSIPRPETTNYNQPYDDCYES